LQGQLFDGLEEEEDLGYGGETFVPRRSVKKLVLRKGGSGGSVNRSGSQVDPKEVSQLDDIHNVTPISR
jgi:hypothetical protein